MTITEAITAYENLAFTHNYVYGYTYKKMVYFSFMEGLNGETCKFDRASGSHGIKVRFHPTNAHKVEFMKHETYALCTEEEWEAYVEAHKHGKQKNRGIAFERILSERFNVEWAPNNDRFNDAPDMVINGVGYQLKFQGAQIIELSTLAKMGVAVA